MAIAPIPGKTNNDLVYYAKCQVGLPYWCGTFGNTASQALYLANKSRLPMFYTADDFPSQYGLRVHDCIGLVKGYLWSETPTSPPIYNGAQDYGVDGMYYASTERGTRDTMDQSINGLLVYNQCLGHVGVYCADGYVYEAMGHAWGVVKTKFSEKPGWYYWSKCPFIRYDDTSLKELAKAGQRGSTTPTTSSSTSTYIQVTLEDTSTSTSNNGTWDLGQLYAGIADTVKEGIESSLDSLEPVYNAALDTSLSQMLALASSKVDEGERWTKARIPLQANQAWSCAFLLACAYEVGGILNVCLYPSCSGQEFVSKTISELNGQFIKGPYSTKSDVTPEPGDIVLFRWKDKSKYISSNVYYTDHVGIVREVSLKQIVVIEGDSTYESNPHRVGLHNYSLDDSAIYGYLRPSWKVTTALAAYSMMTLQDTPVHEAQIRDIGYWKDNRPSAVSGTYPALSIINYTSALAALTGETDIGDETIINMDNVDNNIAQTCLQYLISKKFTISQAVAIVADIRTSCGYVISKSSPGVGILSWVGSRKDAFTKAVPTWKINLTGQLEFMWNELNNTKSSALKSLLSVTDISENAAVQLAKSFYLKYNDKATVDGSNTCGTYAKKLWSQLKVSHTSGFSVTSDENWVNLITADDDIVDINDNVKESVEATKLISKSVKQTGITDSCVRYVDERLANNTAIKIQNLWRNSGKQSYRNIAVLNGYYLVSVVNNIAPVGHIISIQLADRTVINAVVASNIPSGNEWGYEVRSRINIVQWKLANSDQEIDTTGWEGTAVAKIQDWGTYL